MCAGDAAEGAEAKKAEEQAQEVNVWKQKQPQLEASRDEEFDQYLSAMFL